MGWLEARLFIAGFVFVVPFVFAEDCETSMARLAGSSSGSIKPWSMKDKGLDSMTPSDLLPKKFIEEIEEAKGPVKIHFDHGGSSKYLRVTSGRTTFMRTQITDDGSGFLRLDDLSLEDPLGLNNRIGPDQNRKGVSVDVFRYLRDRMLDISKAGGYRGLKTTGQNNFSVAMLYRRAVGMKPVTKEMEDLVNELDDVYRFARKEAPERFRPASVEDFTRSIGTLSDRLHALTNARRARAQTYLATGVAEDMTVLKDAKGKDRAIIFPATEARPEEIVYLYEWQGQKSVLDWNRINLELVREI